MSYLEFCAGDISPCSFILDRLSMCIMTRLANATIIENYQKATEGTQISFSLYLNIYQSYPFDVCDCMHTCQHM